MKLLVAFLVMLALMMIGLVCSKGEIGPAERELQARRELSRQKDQAKEQTAFYTLGVMRALCRQVDLGYFQDSDLRSLVVGECTDMKKMEGFTQ